MTANDPKRTFPTLEYVAIFLPITQFENLLIYLGTATIKPNPPKDGDGKPRVLASSEKPWKTSRRTQDRRAAELH